MARFLLVGPSNAKPGRDDEFNEWYDNVHLRDVCAIPGVISGRRFDAAPASPNAAPGAYLAVYEIEADDPAAVLKELNRRAAGGEMEISDALERTGGQIWLYKERAL